MPTVPPERDVGERLRLGDITVNVAVFEEPPLEELTVTVCDPNPVGV